MARGERLLCNDTAPCHRTSTIFVPAAIVMHSVAGRTNQDGLTGVNVTAARLTELSRHEAFRLQTRAVIAPDVSCSLVVCPDRYVDWLCCDPVARAADLI